ncbi:hypothetical protein XPA_001722 [Xanthoria parietina]
MTDEETLGYYASSKDFCQSCYRYRKQVRFVVRHISERVNLQIQSIRQGKRSISGFPETMQWFLDQQRLETNFGTAIHGSQAIDCERCLAEMSNGVYNLSMKRKSSPSTRTQRSSKKRKQPGLWL